MINILRLFRETLVTPAQGQGLLHRQYYNYRSDRLSSISVVENKPIAAKELTNILDQDLWSLHCRKMPAANIRKFEIKVYTLRSCAFDKT